MLLDGMMKAVERVDAFLVGQGGTGLEEGTLEEEWLELTEKIEGGA